MWQALQLVVGILDLLASWRLYSCAFAGVALGLLVSMLAPDPGFGFVALVACGGIGLLCGLVWEWRS